MRPRPLALTLLVLSACPKAPSESTSAAEPSERVDQRDDEAGNEAGNEAGTTKEPLVHHEEADPPAPTPLPGQVVLTADREHSEVGFAVARATIGHIGHFARFSANLTLDGEQPVGLVITVRTGSVAADQHGLTEHLKGPDFFDVEKFPTATFTATRFVPLADDDESTHRVHGTMQLHGVERELDFPATITLEPTRVIGAAELDISAKAFGIQYEGMAEELAEDRVALEIELVFPRVGAP